MTFMNDNANIKQFQLVRFVNENCSDDHVVTKISIVLRRDKIEAPYYMDTKIKMSTCIDNEENGLIHAMDMLSLNRMHNLTEDAFNEIKSLITDYGESKDLQITGDGEKLKAVLISRSDEEFRDLLENFGELFDKIDYLVE